MSAQDMRTFYRCTWCEWLGTLDDAEDDCSVGADATLCPECFSYIEPNESEVFA